VKLVAVGDAHEVVVRRGLKVQAPEPDFEPGWEGVRTAHGVPLAPVLGANHHRDGWWKLIFGARSPYCDNPPRKILYYRLKPIHFGH
jgi:hypothetical protein